MPAPSASIASSTHQLVAQFPHALWRANQMGYYQGTVLASGYAALDQELPNRGWPRSALIELLVQQSGIGEMQLLQPALARLARTRRIALVQAPHTPQIAAWSGWGLALEQLLWIRTQRSADALWSAEQILRNGSCGALLLWQSHVRAESLRRLHLAAQGSDTLFWMIRPLANAQDSSPALLRLGLRPAQAGIAVDIVKRRGPQCDHSFYVALDQMPAPFSTPALAGLPGLPRDATLDRRVSAVITARNFSPALV